VDATPQKTDPKETTDPSSLELDARAEYYVLGRVAATGLTLRNIRPRSRRKLLYLSRVA
jgi:hypothetical protein